MPNETLVILDYGSQYTQLIARRARELHVYSIILPFSASVDEILKHSPRGVVLSGGPNSVFDKDAPTLPDKLLDQSLPILGVCYGMQLIARHYGGIVEESPTREYGKAEISLTAPSQLINKKFDLSTVWMSHGTHLSKAPANFVVTAMSGETIAAIEDAGQQMYGLQFHPEVAHSQHGRQILEAFIDNCEFAKNWSAASIIDEQIAKIKKAVGTQNVICALSGGVDSSVAATLVHQAIGAQQTCIFVDTGLLRKDEYEEVLEIYKDRGLNVRAVRAGERFLGKLAGVSDPEQKRKIIGGEFIAVFDEEAKKIDNTAFLVQGTLYPDVIESVSVNGPSVTIKSHHNVGGLPEKMNLKLIEPLRELFKDEVRLIGRELGLSETITQRQPFPGPGLAVRIISAITPESIAILQEADAIVREEVQKFYRNPEGPGSSASLGEVEQQTESYPKYGEGAAQTSTTLGAEKGREVFSGSARKQSGLPQVPLWQYFAVLLPVKTVGVMGDGRTHEQVIAIRAVESSDGMTADWARLPHELLAQISSRIVSEVRGVNRVVYDITSKPPGTIEWE